MPSRILAIRRRRHNLIQLAYYYRRFHAPNNIQVRLYRAQVIPPSLLQHSDPSVYLIALAYLQALRYGIIVLLHILFNLIL